MTADRGRVVVADDDVLLREGLASLLANAGFDVIDHVGNAVELLAVVREHRPDLVIVDIRMPPTRTTEGLDAARVIREELPDTAILVLSAHVEVEDSILTGASVVDPPLVQELLSARRVEDPRQVLSQREHEVLALMAEGRSNAGSPTRCG